VDSAGGDGHWSGRLDSHVRERGRFYHRLAYGVLRSHETAADVCQQAFLLAWQQRDRIRDHDALGGWLVRVVLNESFCVLRRSRAERKALMNRSQTGGNEPGPAELAERRDLLMVALSQLPEAIREVVALRTMEGMSGNEVSGLLRINPSDVSRRLHEGLDRLREFLPFACRALRRRLLVRRSRGDGPGSMGRETAP
jgi:RNA polymerase sigma-70 factor (ECF subfamily)